ncbi:zinc knuckle domain-containing protein [Botrytis cinerea]
MDSPAEDAVDSRSNVVGRKRALQTSSDQGREFVTIDSSSDESAKQPRKRAKPSSDESAKVEVDLTSSPLPKESLGTPTSGANVGSPATWNQGVQSGLRTSFKSKKPTPPQSTPLKQPAQPPNNTIEKSQARSEQKPMTKKQFNKLGEDKQLALMEAYTQDVSALIDLHGWPVPEGFQQSCLKFVGEGLTFYPTPMKKDQPVGRYSFGGGDVQLRELYSEEGKPITSKDITYSDVLLSLMENNEFFGHALPDKRAKAAVKSYLSYFYNHLPQKETFISSLVAKAPSPIEVLKNSKKSPPASSRAADHHDKNAPPAIINDGSVKDEALMKQDNTSTSNLITESNGDEEPTRVAPNLATSAIEPTKDRTTPPEAGTTKIDHGSSDPVVGGEMEVSSDGGIATDVDDDREFEAAREMGLRPGIPAEDHAAILKYFPSTDGVVLRKCLICGSSGHDRSVCSDNACSSCGSKGDHLTPACPRNTICGKCREVGHQTSHCPEKLRAVKDDIKCNTCQSTSHLEDQCHVIWRSFLPGPNEIKKVRNILAFCYFCGRPGHFGPECGLYRGKPASGGISWSTSNMERFLDGPSSYDDSLSPGGNDYSIPNRGKKGFTIKGKANDPINLDESDDDEGFIQPKVNMAPRNGHIQFSQAGAMQSFNQAPPFQFQGNTSSNQNSRGPSGNRGGRGGRRGGGSGSSGSSAEKNKQKHKSGNNPPRGGGQSRGKAYRGRGGGGPARGAPRGRR